MANMGNSEDKPRIGSTSAVEVGDGCGCVEIPAELWAMVVLDSGLREDAIFPCASTCRFLRAAVMSRLGDTDLHKVKAAACGWAARRGHLSLLKWYRDFGHPVSGLHACARAARGGWTDILRWWKTWLVSHGERQTDSPRRSS